MSQDNGGKKDLRRLNHELGAQRDRARAEPLCEPGRGAAFTLAQVAELLGLRTG